jgi:tRNA 2-thiouridine synthesizing protein D|tara:strand:- start:318 stop:710 length:393 start_codon:yes stop_codon:yes gene_type:complete
MIYSLAVYGPPYTYQAADTAFYFAEALISKGHELRRVFFYHDGVYNGTRLSVPPQDEVNIPARWSELARRHKIDMVVCVASALRRGVLNEPEADRYDLDSDNMDTTFNLSGLGQLIDAGIQSDRLITFGT